MLSVAKIPVIEIMDTSEQGLQQAVGFDNILLLKPWLKP